MAMPKRVKVRHVVVCEYEAPIEWFGDAQDMQAVKAIAEDTALEDVMGGGGDDAVVTWETTVEEVE